MPNNHLWKMLKRMNDMDFEADDLLEEGFFFLDETDALDEESDGYNSGDEEVGEGVLRQNVRLRVKSPSVNNIIQAHSDRTKRQWPGLDRPGSSLGKPEIPWTPNIASGLDWPRSGSEHCEQCLNTNLT